MNAAIRFLSRVAPSAALSLALGLGSWQVASAQAPPAGPAVVPVGPAIAGPVGPAGPAVAGPIGPAVGPAVDGPDGPIVDAPPPGPALVHHFVHIVRFPRYREMVEYRTELLLFADNTYNMIYPNMGQGWGGPAANAGPETIVGTWGMKDDYLAITFQDGFIDYGVMAVGQAGPLLRFAGRRWTDLLAVAPPVAPAGPVGPGVAGPVGPGLAAPIGPALAAPVGPAIAAPVGPAPQ